MSHSIPLTPDQIIYLANGIFRAVTYDLPELIYENELPTSVGRGLFRWNFINRNLSEGLGVDFQISFQKRGAWKFLLLYDPVSNFSISIMTEQNLKKLQRYPSPKPHYLEALVSANQLREPIEGQLCIEEMRPSRNLSVLSELRNQLLSGFFGIINEHLLILFDYDYNGVTSARAVLLTPNLEIAVSDDWTQYLKAQPIPHMPLADIIPDDEPMVKLKKEYLPQESSLVSIHNVETTINNESEQ